MKHFNAFTVALFIVSTSVLSARGDEIEEIPIDERDREHWSYQTLTKPPVPRIENDSFSHNPIDRFVLAKLQAKEIAPQATADRLSLIRRLTIDLTGLPPTPSEIDAFLADDRPDAYSQLVDRLLASPAFGENLAQPWLDLARWAETDGFEHDKLRPKAVRYRDWVIEAFNRDLAYDQFVQLQIAGDELKRGDDWAHAATGFCLAGPDMPDINLKQERRHTVLNDMTATVGSVFLGMQFGCAQCHDHKFDPISQADFYRLRAIFEPTVTFTGHYFQEKTADAKPSYLYLRGDFRSPGPEVQPDFPRVVNIWDTQLKPPADDAISTGRREQFAKWLTKNDHPLTSRVIVNRIWQHHFGNGLCESPSDFGYMGDEPRHRDLLDWLACELVDHDWSMKHIHRLIVGSATYQRASRPDSIDDQAWQTSVELDPRNRYWSRFTRRRVSGEVLRDMMLSVSGSLMPSASGRSVRPPLPREVVQTLLRPDHWKVSPDKEDHYRRSIYLFARRNLRFPLFEAFDRPSASATCARRSKSIIAPQSLILFNSEYSLDLAQRFAQLVQAEGGSTLDNQMNFVYRRAFGRLPKAEEREDIREFFKSHADPSDAMTDFCLAVMNSSEFLYIE